MSAYVEMVYEALNMDMVPGASERNSAPEHLWNAAQCWHQDIDVASQTAGPYVLAGYYGIRDDGASMLG